MSLTIEQRLEALEADVAKLKLLRRATYSEIKQSNRQKWLRSFDEYDTTPDMTLSVSQLSDMCGCDKKTIRKLGVRKSCTADVFRRLLNG